MVTAKWFEGSDVHPKRTELHSVAVEACNVFDLFVWMQSIFNWQVVSAVTYTSACFAFVAIQELYVHTTY